MIGFYGLPFTQTKTYTMKKISTILLFLGIALGSAAQQDLAINLIYPQDGDTTIASMTYTFEVCNNGSNTITAGTDLYVEFVGITGSLTSVSPFDFTVQNDLAPGNCDTFDISVNWNVTNPPITFDICLWLLGATGDYSLSGGIQYGNIAGVLTNDPTPADNEACITQTIGDNQPPTNILIDNDNMDENNSPGAIFGQLSATDPDSTDTHTFSLVNGSGSAENSLFQILGGNQLTTLVSLDYEAMSVMHIRVRVEDQATNDFEKILTLYVNDVIETGVAENSLFAPEVKVYPQPAANSAVIEFPLKDMWDGAVLNVFDASGKLVRSVSVKDARYTFDTSSLAEGLYHFQLESSATVRYRGKIVVAR